MDTNTATRDDLQEVHSSLNHNNDGNSEAEKRRQEEDEYARRQAEFNLEEENYDDVNDTWMMNDNTSEERRKRKEFRKKLGEIDINLEFIHWMFTEVEQPLSNAENQAPRKNPTRTTRKQEQQYEKEQHQPDWSYLDLIQCPQKDTGDGKHTISSQEFENWCKGEVDPKASAKHNSVGAGAQHQKNMTDVVSWDDDGKFRFTYKVGPLNLWKLIWCIVHSRLTADKRRYALKDILVRMTAFLEKGLDCPRNHWGQGVKFTPPMIRLIDVALKVIRISKTKGANGRVIDLTKEYKKVCKEWEQCLGRPLESINTVWSKKDRDYETQDRETGKFIKFEFNQSLSDFL